MHRSVVVCCEIGIEVPRRQRKPAKVTTMIQYRQASMIVVTMSTGHLAVVDLLKQSVVSLIKAHKGNVTSACFLNNFEHFATASGGFSRRHDNSINIYRVFEVL